MIRPLMAVEGRAFSFIVTEDDKEVVRVQTNKRFTVDELRDVFIEKKPKRKKK